jgi:hypothetical protein
MFTKKIDGKWRYYYDVGVASRHTVNDRKQDQRYQSYTWLQDKLGYDERERYNRSYSKYKLAYNNANPREGKLYNSSREMQLERDRVAALGKKMLLAQKEYDRTPLGIIDNASYSIKKAKKNGWAKK